MISRMSNSSGMVSRARQRGCSHSPTTTSLHLTPRTTELDDIVSTRCHQHEIIDNSLRSFLNVTTNYKCTPAPPPSPPDWPSSALTASSRLPSDRLQHCQMHIPHARGRAVCLEQAVCPAADNILPTTSTWEHTPRHEREQWAGCVWGGDMRADGCTGR